ncbi:MAG: hypothetical protein L6E13_08790 [Firmicutes bacterium]|nr:hypothetical protein [Bacillota bacterium]
MRGLLIGAGAGLLTTVLTVLALVALGLVRRWGHGLVAVLAALAGGLVALVLSEVLV